MKRAKGKVVLVGAGPGDPGLLTLKGLECLQKADVVLYDHLVNPELLGFVRPGARHIFVGKRGPGSSKKQETIYRLLARESKNAGLVVRLKGGDPYLFGRGAEEGVFLKKHGIPFEVIPGVTSALGCGAAAGIPLTERHTSSSVSFITGHEAEEGRLGRIAWRSLVQSAQTLVVYMGLSRISDITAALIRNGASPQTPAAVVQWGTWSRQKTCEGRLGNIAGKVRKAGMGAPAVLFVGPTVRFRRELNWFEKRPLFGRTVVLTRPETQMLPFRRALENLGARVLEIPAIEIRESTATRDALDAAIIDLGAFDWIVFTSTNGVDAFFGRLESRFRKDGRALALAKVAAVGEATRERLRDRGIEPDFVPTQFSTLDLFKELNARFRPIAGLRFLLVRSQIAPPLLTRKLEQKGARVTEVAAYRTLMPRGPIRRAFRRTQPAPDAICFTSASTAQGFLSAVPPGEFRRRWKGTRIVSIGPVTSRAVRERGLRVHAEARPYTADGLVRALTRLFNLGG